MNGWNNDCKDIEIDLQSAALTVRNVWHYQQGAAQS